MVLSFDGLCCIGSRMGSHVITCYTPIKRKMMYEMMCKMEN